MLVDTATGSIDTATGSIETAAADAATAEAAGYDGLFTGELNGDPFLTRLSKAGRGNEMKHLITDEVVETFAIVAPVNEVPQILNRRLGDMVDGVSFLSRTQHPELVAPCRAARSQPSWGVAASIICRYF